MNKFMLFAACVLIVTTPFTSSAQDDRNTTQEVKQGVKKAGKSVKKGVKKGAHEVAEQASEAKSDILYTEAENKMGPNGEDIFIDKNSRYYYVNDKGHNVYVPASELRNRPAKKDDD